MKDIEFHVHPFIDIGRNTVRDVVDAMDYSGLDVIALESLDASLYPLVVSQTKQSYPGCEVDPCGVSLSDGKYLLNAREYNTNEDFHILTVGYSSQSATPDTEVRKVIDEALENEALVILDHPFADNGRTRTAGHISGQKEDELEGLCKEYSGQVALEWNGYCKPWMRMGLKYAVKALGQGCDYHDVNKRAEVLSDKLKAQGYNLPVLADTDLHARTKYHLKAMGTARIRTELDGQSAKDIVQEMRKNIFEGNYENVKRYVSCPHILGAYCIPILFPKHFVKPRA